MIGKLSREKPLNIIKSSIGAIEMPRNDKNSELKERNIFFAIFLLLLMIIDGIIAIQFTTINGMRAYVHSNLDGIIVGGSVTLLGISLALYAFLVTSINSFKERILRLLEQKSKSVNIESKLETSEFSDKFRKALEGVHNSVAYFFFVTAISSAISIGLGLEIEILFDSTLIGLQVLMFLVSLELLFVSAWNGFKLVEMDLKG